MKLVPVGLVPRFGASIIDGIIVAVISLVIALPTGLMHAAIDGRDVGFLLASFIISLVYEVALVSRNGRTIGMKVSGIGVSTNGETFTSVPIAKSLTRYCVKTFEPITLILSLVNVLGWLPLLYIVVLVVSIGRNPERRGFHDRAAGTWMLGTANASQNADEAAPPGQPGWLDDAKPFDQR
jgi:uncharacterized RDD family membrane protein YckC